MKRFFVLTAVIGLLAGLGAQSLADTWTACTGANAGYCKWGSSCNALSSCTGGAPGSDCANNGSSCDGVIKNCTDNSPSHAVFSDAACTQVVVKGDVEECGKWCDWGGTTGCQSVKTDPNATFSPTPITSCPDAIANCTAGGGTLFSEENCGGTPSGGGGDPPGGGTTGGHCKIDGAFAFCGYAAYGDDPDGCYKLSNQYPPDTGKTCDELITACRGNYGTVYTGSSVPPVLNETPYGKGVSCSSLGLTSATSVKLAGSKAATPGLKVSYAKNRVTVNWTPAAKISSGTIQLLNAKGAALSTSYIKANSGKVTAKLATVGVPAGMYFVHISAVGVNGQKIVSQSAVSIVK